MANSKEDALHEARSLLAKIHHRKQKGQELIFQDSKQAAETLCCTIHLLQRLQSSLALEAFSLDPSSPDWKVVKALLELLVRLGICPHLCSGVGIPRDKHSEASSSFLAAAASTISMDLSGLSISSPSLQSSGLASHTGMLILAVCAETLASFIWKSSKPNETPVCSRPCKFLDETHTRDVKTEDMTALDIGTCVSAVEQSSDVSGPAGNTLSPAMPSNKTSAPSHSHNETYVPPFPPITQLVMKFFLWDLMAAYLQLGFGPQERDENVTSCTHDAKVQLQRMVQQLPVEQMVMASFVLLNRVSPPPPPWITAELGKQLSKLVMRTRGLVTILEELVGRVTKGNVESYDKVAGHLAKVPKSVATADEYFKAICPQLLPLLLFKHKPRDSALGETSLIALNNIYHTAVSLTCKLFLTEPVLAKKYLVQPLMRPLEALNLMQKRTDMAVDLSSKHAKEKYTELLVTENEVVDSLVRFGVLLTAGCAGSSVTREVILLETRGMATLFLKLHFRLAPNDDPNPLILSGSNKCALKNPKSHALESKGITKGFLHKGLGYGGPSEQAYEHPSTLLKLKSSLADVVMAEVNQPVDLALPCILSVLLEHKEDMVVWPRVEGEIWESLQSKACQSSSTAMYLSRLLLTVENWPLVLALMDKILHKILDLRLLLIKSNGSEIPSADELLRYMQYFEELNNEAGTKALEQDSCGAASLVKALLEDELVLSDEDMLELVLHMVNSLLKGIRSSRRDDLQMSGVYSHVCGSVLTDLLSSVERVYGNACVGEKLRQMSFTLAEEISAFCKAL